MAAQSPFDAAIRQLTSAHDVAVSTLEGEVQRLRHENLWLRAQLAEAGLCPAACASAPAACSAEAGAAGCSAVVLADTAGKAVPVAPSGQALGPAPAPAPAPVAPVPPSAAGTGQPDVERVLDSVLACHGWQHLSIQQVAGRWLIADAPFQLRVTERPEARGQYELYASEDGQAWELFESVVRKYRLHKVVRTAPLASLAGCSAEATCRVAEMGRPAPVTAPVVHRSLDLAAGFQSSPGHVVPEGPCLPPVRADGLPAFSDAFAGPPATSAQYYTRFRVPPPRHPA